MPSSRRPSAQTRCMTPTPGRATTKAVGHGGQLRGHLSAEILPGEVRSTGLLPCDTAHDWGVPRKNRARESRGHAVERVDRSKVTHLTHRDVIQGPHCVGGRGHESRVYMQCGPRLGRVWKLESPRDAKAALKKHEIARGGLGAHAGAKEFRRIISIRGNDADIRRRYLSPRATPLDHHTTDLFQRGWRYVAVTDIAHSAHCSPECSSRGFRTRSCINEAPPSGSGWSAGWRDRVSGCSCCSWAAVCAVDRPAGWFCR